MQLLQKIINAFLVVQPPHPLFVHFPIALITTAFFFLILAMWRKSSLLDKVAFANLALAAVSIFVTGAFGIRCNWERISGLQLGFGACHLSTD